MLFLGQLARNARKIQRDSGGLFDGVALRCRRCAIEFHPDLELAARQRVESDVGHRHGLGQRKRCRQQPGNDNSDGPAECSAHRGNGLRTHDGYPVHTVSTLYFSSASFIVRGLRIHPPTPFGTISSTAMLVSVVSTIFPWFLPR